MTRAVIIDGRDIGLAQQATADVLHHVLTHAGTDFATWAVLDTLHRRGIAVPRAELVAAIARRQATPPGEVEATVDELEAAGLVQVVTPPDGDPAGVTLRPTTAGTRRHRELRAAVDHASDQLFADIPRSEQRAAQRVLATVTMRAEAWLRAQTAATSGPNAVREAS